MVRLEQRVVLEGVAGLRDPVDAEVGLEHQLEATRRQERRELALLARVGGGQDDPHGGASACDCSEHSSPMPVTARFSSASSSWRRNAWPSAVPCTSMKAPPLFITTFMSVSASESSL